MVALNVSIERKGRLLPVGTIVGKDTADARFSYDPDYLKEPESHAVSISLPLREEPFSPLQTKTFFEGLLPEGFTRRSVAGGLHLPEDDYLGMLAALGRECLGAIRITSAAEPNIEEVRYEKLSAKAIRELAKEGQTESVQLITKAHLSLTGASGKAGLYYLATKNSWYLPLGLAPSTHIVKQSHVRLDNIVTNEQLCMMTAANLGIPVPESFILQTTGEDEAVLFATKRFDRVINAQCRMERGLPIPLRLHQEDFAQALGIPGSEKYEKPGEHHLQKMFALLRAYSSDPLEDQMKLISMLIFDYLIGNTDNHIKNFSLLYNEKLSGMTLAPAYDILSTAIYPDSTRDMAFHIGGKYSLDEIDQQSWERAALEARLNPRVVLARYKMIKNSFRPALNAAADSLDKQGFSKAKEMQRLILKHAPGGQK